ncbi:hypothetical protein DSLASN_02280 [Desulfoluna limicola]|uniref:Transposase n=1 Tax=Desulfoluna limicola TaxID=2810562 RepID=A0ABN6EZE2_9BACT|nr:hypothetical protein [Desulfoluna limicola]BCS94596.1 hypothetical protein DSLASN_02280 [Desulfoluna limicola]
MSQTRARQIYEANVFRFFIDKGLDENGKLKSLAVLRRIGPGHCNY